METRTATVNGVPMRWEEQAGEGLPLVLVHGIPTGPRLWRHVVPRIAAGARCLAWEMVATSTGSATIADDTAPTAATKPRS